MMTLDVMWWRMRFIHVRSVMEVRSVYRGWWWSWRMSVRWLAVVRWRRISADG